MGKGAALIPVENLKPFLLRAGAVLGSILAMLTAGLALIDYKSSLFEGVLYITLSAIIAGAVNWRTLFPHQLDPDDLPDQEGGYRVRSPCDLKLSNKAKELAAKCFFDSYCIEPDVFEQHRLKNPNILACLVDSKGDFKGYFDAIPLTVRFAERFLAGEVTEEEITHEDVLAPDEAKSCKYLFIAGLAACDPKTAGGRKSGQILVWALHRYLLKHYSGAKPTLFAVAASGTGEKLLKKFQLTLTSLKEDRRDSYNLYSLKLNREELKNRLRCLPDWSAICSLDWDEGGVRQAVPKVGKRVTLPTTKIWNLEQGTQQAN